MWSAQPYIRAFSSADGKILCLKSVSISQDHSFINEETALAGQNLSRKQIIAHEIREYLLGLPPAKHSPLGANDDLADELSMLQGIISRLWKFVRFMQKLNPMEYLRWMHDAFARKMNDLKGSDNTLSTQFYPDEELADSDIEMSNQTHHVAAVDTPSTDLSTSADPAP